ncbi:MAG: MinD/ParA family protein [Cellulosilyticaceae bacterium]
MNDQAQMLRNRVAQVSNQSKMKIITITSGKGGVGKSNFTTNIATALSQYGKSPIILDADFGLANVEIIYGQRPKYNLTHLIHGQCTTKEIITPTPYGVSFISGGSGVKEMLFLGPQELDMISNQLETLEEMTDLLLIDTGAGINDIILKFSELADEIYLVVTPEPASITDAYALIKTLVKDFQMKPYVKVVINKAMNKQEAHEVFQKISYVSQQFLNLTIHYAGFVPYDPKLFEAVKNQKPVVVYDEKSMATAAYKAIAKNILCMEVTEEKSNEGWKEKFKKVFGFKKSS